MYQKAESCFWTVEDIDCSQDVIDWNTLPDVERHFVGSVLASLVISSANVTTHINRHLACTVQSAEARCLFGFQIAT
jgi:ribonucleotide reductase beta subunit family protein with ferritin-like domain